MFLRNSIKINRFELILLCLAFFLRLAVFGCAHKNPDRFLDVDSTSYLKAAENFSSTYFDPDSKNLPLSLFRTPLYPLFIYITKNLFYSIKVTVIFQIVISTLIVFITYKILQTIYNKHTGICLLLMTVNPISILYSNYIMTETLFALFLCIGTYYWLKVQDNSIYSIKSGLFFGLSTLIRPISLYFPIFFLPLQAIVKKYRRLTKVYFIFLLCFILPVGGWIIRNYIVSGIVTFSTIQGTNMLLYRGAGVIAEVEQISFEDAQKMLIESAQNAIPPDLNYAEISNLFTKMGIKILLQYPLETAKVTIKGLLHLLLGPGKTPLKKLIFGNIGRSKSKYIFFTLIGLEIIYILFLYTGILALGFFIFKKEAVVNKLWPIICLIIYYLLISAGPEAYSRFRVPISPFLVILSSYGYAKLIDKFNLNSVLDNLSPKNS